MKKMIEAKNLVFEYIRRDEEGNVDGIIRAVDGVTLDVQPGDFVVVAAVIADIDTEEGLLVVNRIGMFQITDEEVEHVDSPFGFVVAPPS